LFRLFQLRIFQEWFPECGFEDPVPGQTFQRFFEVALFPDTDLVDAKILEAEAFHQ
jgi:hypothetical protein